MSDKTKKWHEYTASEREAEVGQIAEVVAMSSRIRHSARTEAAIAHLREPKRECDTCGHYDGEFCGAHSWEVPATHLCSDWEPRDA